MKNIDIVALRVALILTEMGLVWPISPIEKYVVKNCGARCLYEFRFTVRDDVDTTNFVVDFCAAMEAYNQISQVKADFHEFIECDFSGPVKNWHTAYLTVKVL